MRKINTLGLLISSILILKTVTIFLVNFFNKKIQHYFINLFDNYHHKKILVSIIFVIFINITVKSQLLQYNFSQTTDSYNLSCTTTPNNASSITTNGNYTTSNFSRVGLTCEQASFGFNSSNFPSTSTLASTRYLEITITASSEKYLILTSLNYNLTRGTTGPSSVVVAHNFSNGGAFSTQSSPVTVTSTTPTSPNNFTWDFDDLSISPNNSVTFRIYGYNASSSFSALRLTTFILNGSVSSGIISQDVVQNRVGIGVSNPGAGLQIGSGQGLKDLWFVNSASTIKMGVAWGSSDILSTATQGDFAITNYSGVKDILFGSGTVERMRMKANGNIGIGIVNPIQKLHVDGNGLFTGSLSVGTTTTNSNYMLLVEGVVGARKIKVTSSTIWADYVFKKDYNLMPLHKLEKFIKANNHLPEIPTTEEVTKNGYDLNEMDSKLLQKVEELTLYVIDLEKKIKQLEIQQKTKKTK